MNMDNTDSTEDASSSNTASGYDCVSNNGICAALASRVSHRSNISDAKCERNRVKHCKYSIFDTTEPISGKDRKCCSTGFGIPVAASRGAKGFRA